MHATYLFKTFEQFLSRECTLQVIQKHICGICCSFHSSGLLVLVLATLYSLITYSGHGNCSCMADPKKNLLLALDFVCHQFFPPLSGYLSCCSSVIWLAVKCELKNIVAKCTVTTRPASLTLRHILHSCSTIHFYAPFTWLPFFRCSYTRQYSKIKAYHGW